jgi:hypothetical protein
MKLQNEPDPVQSKLRMQEMHTQQDRSNHPTSTWQKRRKMATPKAVHMPEEDLFSKCFQNLLSADAGSVSPAAPEVKTF